MSDSKFRQSDWVQLWNWGKKKKKCETDTGWTGLELVTISTNKLPLSWTQKPWQAPKALYIEVDCMSSEQAARRQGDPTVASASYSPLSHLHKQEQKREEGINAFYLCNQFSWLVVVCVVLRWFSPTCIDSFISFNTGSSRPHSHAHTLCLGESVRWELLRAVCIGLQACHWIRFCACVCETGWNGFDLQSPNSR